MGDSSDKKPIALVVEGEVLLRMVSSDLTADAGYDVREFAWPSEALDYLRAHPEDIALVVSHVRTTDKIDGCALARAVAAGWPDVAIVLLSGTALATNEPIPASAVFVRRPCSAETFTAAIDNAIALTAAVSV